MGTTHYTSAHGLKMAFFLLVVFALLAVVQGVPASTQLIPGSNDVLVRDKTYSERVYAESEFDMYAVTGHLRHILSALPSPVHTFVSILIRVGIVSVMLSPSSRYMLPMLSVLYRGTERLERVAEPGITREIERVLDMIFFFLTNYRRNDLEQ